MVNQDSRQAEWNDTLVNASRALALLDADRLEEMALSCAALMREQPAAQFHANRQGKPGFEEMGEEMAIFARVLEATRVNLNVMRRLRAVRTHQLEYGQGCDPCRVSGEAENGDH